MATNCTLTANSAAVDGGGLAIDSGGVATVMASTFSTNTASAVGGAIHSAGEAAIIQSTFWGNSAAGAGGGAMNAHASSVSLFLAGCTISGNSATGGSGQGGGVRRAGGTVTITNCIVAGNTASTGGTEDLSGAITTTGPNLIGVGPLLAPPGNYGGPTQTRPPLLGSPAIDGATNGSAYAVDQRGLPRVVGAFPDLGAVEAQVASSGNPPVLMNCIWSSGGGSGATFQFSFTNSANLDFTALTSTNVALPLTNWTILGNAIQVTPGVYQFTDPGATNDPQRFYQVVSP